MEGVGGGPGGAGRLGGWNVGGTEAGDVEILEGEPAREEEVRFPGGVPGPGGGTCVYVNRGGW